MVNFIDQNFDSSLAHNTCDRILNEFHLASKLTTHVSLDTVIQRLGSRGLWSIITDKDLEPIWTELRKVDREEWLPLLSILLRKLMNERRDALLSDKRVLPDCAKLIFATSVRVYGPGPDST